MNRKMTGAETPQVKHDELYDRIMGLVRTYVSGYVFIETGLRWEEYVIQRFLDAGLVRLASFPLTYRSGAKLMENVLVCASASLLIPEFTFCPSPYRGAELVRRVVGSVARPGGIVAGPVLRDGLHGTGGGRCGDAVPGQRTEPGAAGQDDCVPQEIDVTQRFLLDNKPLVGLIWFWFNNL